MHVTSRSVEPATRVLLPGTLTRDAYRLTVDDVTIDATTAATCIFSRVPRWTRTFMALCNQLVRSVGLETSLSHQSGAPGSIGVFPVIAEAPDRVLPMTSIGICPS